MRILALIVGLCAATPASAVFWPSAAPCNTTLQACINATPAGGTVFVASSAVIDETLLVNKPFTLAAAAGYRPVLAAGRAVGGNVTAAGAWSWTLEGFELTRGFVSVLVNSGTTVNVNIRRVRVRATEDEAAQISLYNNSSAALSYDLAQNELDYTATTVDGALHAALQVLDSGTGSSAGRIRENRIIARGSQAIGVLISTQDRNHTGYVLGNHVLGGNRGSIFLRQGSLVAVTGGSLQARVLNNVVRGTSPGANDADGIVVDIYDGGAGIIALHNTVVDARTGIDVFADPSATPLSGRIERNLLAYLTFEGIRRGGAFNAGNVPDAANLFFDTSDVAASVSPSSIFADPLLVRVPDDPHLRAGSPAIDAVDGVALADLLIAEGLPQLDGDGLRRVKRVAAAPPTFPADIGALEYGDLSLLHTVAAGPGNVSQINDSAINGDSMAYPQIAANWNPDGSSGTYSDHATSLYYGSSRWTLRTEDLQPFVAGSDFNVFAPARGDGRYRHANTAGSIAGSETLLDAAGLNGQSNRILLATRDPFGSATVNDLNTPFAVRYLPDLWGVLRLDGATMPASGGFYIYFQEPSFNAFQHTSSSANVSGNYTRIDHSLLNDRRCARFHITQSATGTSNVHNVGVFYSSSARRWAIFNQDLAAMPVGSVYNVVVDPQRSECPDQLLSDGFENPPAA